jgi:hypothetical protein
VKTSQSQRAQGAPERLRDHDSVGHVGMYGIRHLSRVLPPRRDGGEPQDHGRGDGETAHTMAQKAFQDRLMSRSSTMPSRAIIRWLRGSWSKVVRTRGTCWNVAGGLVGTAFASTEGSQRTARRKVRSWTSGSTQPGNRRGNGGHGRGSGPCSSRSQESRS